MSDIVRRTESCSHRSCDFCGATIGSKACFGTTRDSDRDICGNCIEKSYNNMCGVSSNKSIAETIFTMISSVAKRLLDKDTKSLIKAGYLSTDLKITPEGQEALLALNLSQNMKDLVTLAEEKMEEAKEAKA